MRKRDQEAGQMIRGGEIRVRRFYIEMFSHLQTGV